MTAAQSLSHWQPVSSNRVSAAGREHARGLWCRNTSLADLSAPCRKTLADYLKDLRSVEGGDRQLTSWLKEEGFQTSLRTINQVCVLSLHGNIAVETDHTELCNAFCVRNCKRGGVGHTAALASMEDWRIPATLHRSRQLPVHMCKDIAFQSAPQHLAACMRVCSSIKSCVL